MAATRPLDITMAAASISATGTPVVFKAEEAQAKKLARFFEILGVDSLEADLLATGEGARVRVTGRIRAKVRQACVVTLEPVTETIDENIEIVFAPPDEAEAAAEAAGFSDQDIDPTKMDVSGIDLDMLMDPDKLPEPIENGRIDFGAVITDTVLLHLEPYPRKAGVSFKPPEASGPDVSPFAVLAQWRKPE